MNVEEFNHHVEHVHRRSSLVLVKKRDEYAKDKDVFVNFNDGSELSLHSQSSSVAWEYNVKHLQSLKHCLLHLEKTGELPDYVTNDWLNEKFGDINNYFILLEGILKEKMKNKFIQTNKLTQLEIDTAKL